MEAFKGAHDRRQVISRSNNAVSLENADNAENIIPSHAGNAAEINSRFYIIRAGPLESRWL